MAYAAEKLGVPCDLYVPEYVPPRMLDKLKSYNANVTVIGRDWTEANMAAEETLNNNPGTVLIHPFDHPTIW